MSQMGLHTPSGSTMFHTGGSPQSGEWNTQGCHAPIPCPRQSHVDRVVSLDRTVKSSSQQKSLGRATTRSKAVIRSLLSWLPKPSRAPGCCRAQPAEASALGSWAGRDKVPQPECATSRFWRSEVPAGAAGRGGPCSGLADDHRLTGPAVAERAGSLASLLGRTQARQTRARPLGPHQPLESLPPAPSPESHGAAKSFHIRVWGGQGRDSVHSKEQHVMDPK